jgi:hypothetical protein
MLASRLVAPTDSRSGSRLSQAHTYVVPVVREFPRPIPGLGNSAW